MNERLLTLREIAEKLNVNEMTVRRLITKAKEKCVNPIPFAEVGGVYRFDSDAINIWIANGGSNAKDD